MKEKSKLDRIVHQINKHIDSLLMVQRKTVTQVRKYLYRYYETADIYRALDEQLQTTPSKELTFLAISINRERYLSLFLKYYGSVAVVIDESLLLTDVHDSPLSDTEEKILVQYIIENWQYDIRLLSLLSPASLNSALDGITAKIDIDGLKIKHLQALNHSEAHIACIQERIRNSINEVPEWRKTWMPFLDLSIHDNQAILSKQYSIIDIHSYLRKNSRIYVHSPFENVRIALKLIHHIELNSEESTKLKCYIIELIDSLINVDQDQSVIDLLQDAAQTDKGFAEALLITLYRKTKVYTKSVLNALLSISSEFAYKELVAQLLTAPKKKRIPIALQLLQYYPHKADAILDYAKTCDDISLIKCIESQVSRLPQNKKPSATRSVNLSNAFSIIPPETELNELLKDLAIGLEANTFLASVGFVFSSGLSLLSSVFDYITSRGGNIEIISGSLQNYNTANKNTKIDKHTVVCLNQLISSIGVKLYTYEDSFYHGKFYYLAGPEKAAVIVGSSNISKTAFFDNYELNILISIDLTTDKENSFINWYQEFKKQCVPISRLNENLFTDLDWDSELNVYNEHFVKMMPTNEILHKIQKLSDSITKRRMENWMRHNPSLCLSVHNIDALSNYVMFVFKDKRLAAFETFDLNNAYYVFDCDDYGQLIERISTMQKDEMVTLSEYKRRGYHIQDQDRLQENIDIYFR